MGSIAKVGLAPVTGGASLLGGSGALGSIGGILNGGFDAATGQNSYRAGSAQIDSPVSADQANSANQQATAAIAQQQAFLQALQGQNGIGNQSSVFNQLQGVANGTGPNPAQAALNQATSANVANQAALMAGQRGANANAGMIARQAAMQGGNIQQQAAAQGATMQAQQQLNAMGQLGGVAGQQVAQQQNALTGYNQFAQGNQQNLLNSVNNANNARVNMASNMNSVNAGVTGANAKGKSDFIGGLLQGGGAAMGMAQGGEVPHYAMGTDYVSPFGLSSPQAPAAPFGGLGADLSSLQSNPSDPVMSFMKGDHSADAAASQPPKAAQVDPNASGSYKSGQGVGKGIGTGMAALFAAKGGKVPAIVSPGEVYLTPGKAKAVAERKADPIHNGKHVPGKAKFKGDNYANDTVPTHLDVGGVVIPKSVMESKNPHKEAYKFVDAIMAKHNIKRGKK